MKCFAGTIRVRQIWLLTFRGKKFTTRNQLHLCGKLVFKSRSVYTYIHTTRVYVHHIMRKCIKIFQTLYKYLSQYIYFCILMGIYYSCIYIHVGKKIISIVVGHMRFFFYLLALRWDVAENVFVEVLNL